VTRFCDDTRIWPTNNISERGVRPLKTQQKISGRLASDDVTQDRLDIRSYIDTARKHGRNAMDVLHDLCSAGPGDRPHPRSPRSHQPETALPITTREWAECLLKRFVCTARRYRTIDIKAGNHNITAADRCPATSMKLRPHPPRSRCALIEPSRVCVRDHPPPPGIDRLVLAEAEPGPAGPARPGSPAERRDARRPSRQGHPRIADPRSKRWMKKAWMKKAQWPGQRAVEDVHLKRDDV
jgi:hypothetical protein